jgi:hypothetical protein
MEDITKATNNFDKSRELGTGGHATVYKGILGDNKVVAVRENRVESILDPSIMGAGMEELLQEVAHLARLCLSYNGEERPSMTQVADKLKAIRSTWKQILQLKHEETRHPVEQLSMGSFCYLSPSMYWTARMLGVDIET